MNVVDFVLLALIVCAALFAIKRCCRAEKSGCCVGCGGNCAGCHMACGHADLPKNL